MALKLLLKVFLAFSICFGQDFAVEITKDNACEVCSCGPGPSLHPKELVKCQDPDSMLEFASLPAIVRGVDIENASKGVIFKRGAIRVRKNNFVYKINVNKASTLEFAEKSTTIYLNNGTVHFNINNVGHLKIQSRAVSASAGNFVLKVEETVAVDISGQAFDVMTSASLNNIGQLNLAPAAFKPNAPLNFQQPTTTLGFANIESIPGLPMEAFSSAQSILFSHCKITDIESTAFSGMSVNNVTFESTTVERIHSSAFPNQNVVENLSFVNCTMISISEKAVTSAISTLRLLHTNFSSINHEAFHVTVATVDVQGCFFKTLVHKSFVFRSWNEVHFKSNTFSFLEEDSLMGIEEPNSPSTFYFMDNFVQNANKNGLKVDENASKNITEGNTFRKECQCDYDKYLMDVSGETDFKNPSKWTVALLNTSLCQVPSYAQGCFDRSKVLVSDYSFKMCSMMASTDCSYESPWEILKEHIELNIDKGILLVVLMFVLCSTLIVGIFTLFRWIIYTIQVRKFDHHKDNWSFTKIEEQQKLKENDLIEEAIELEDSPSPTQHYESLALTANTEVNTPPDLKPKNNGDAIDEKEPLLMAKLPEVATEGAPPVQTTFYDEMICLLQEKLEDPENYATVADDKEMTNNATLYMDPTNLNKT